MSHVIMDYQEALKATGNDKVAAAILALATAIEDKEIFSDSFGHELCMGIRHGLFGVNASENESLYALKVSLNNYESDVPLQVSLSNSDQVPLKIEKQ